VSRVLSGSQQLAAVAAVLVLTIGGPLAAASPDLADLLAVEAPALPSAALPGATLPRGLAFASAAPVGQAIYVFGGLTGASWTGQVLRFDTATQASPPVVAELAPKRGWTSACSDGQRFVYVFGGEGSRGTVLDSIVRFDAATHQWDTVAALPFAVSKTSAVCAHGKAWVFGGHDGAQFRDEVVEFDPATNQARVVARLPQAAAGTSATFSPLTGEATVFGGRNGECPLNRIVRYVPGAATASNSKALLGARYGIAAAHHDGQDFLLGGWRGASPACKDGLTDGTRVYNALHERCCLVGEGLTSARYGAAAATVDGRIWLLGGATSTPRLRFADDIASFTPPALLGAHIHAAWLHPSRFSQDQLKERIDATGLNVVTFGVSAFMNGAANTAGALLDTIGPLPATLQVNTCSDGDHRSAPRNRTDAELRDIFEEFAALPHANLRAVVGCNEPLTKAWPTRGDALYRVQQEARVWRALSDVPICHKITNPLSNDNTAEGTGARIAWPAIEALWDAHQDAICYDWYRGPDFNHTLDYLKAQADQRGMRIHILEANIPGGHDTAWLRDNLHRIATGRGDTYATYYLLDNATAGATYKVGTPGAAWVYDMAQPKAQQWQLQADGRALRCVLRGLNC
jgi:hypothetical protein